MKQAFLILLCYVTVAVQAQTNKGILLHGIKNATGTKALRYNPSTGTISYADTTSGGVSDSAIWKNDGTMTANHTLNGVGFSLTLGASGNKLSTITTNTSGAATYNSDSHTFNDGNGHSFSFLSGFFIIGGSLNLKVERATDANTSVTTSSCVFILPDITAGRTLSLPATAREGMVYVIINTNTTGNSWSFGGGGSLVDQAGSAVTSFTNGVTYIIVGDNSANKYRIIK